MSDVITKSLEAFRDWITHFESRFTSHKDAIMPRIAELEANMAAMATVVDHVSTEMADLKTKLEAATAEDPRIGALADQSAAILAKLNAAVPAPTVEATGEPIAEQ